MKKPRQRKAIKLSKFSWLKGGWARQPGDKENGWSKAMRCGLEEAGARGTAPPRLQGQTGLAPRVQSSG